MKTATRSRMVEVDKGNGQYKTKSDARKGESIAKKTKKNNRIVRNF